jgi:tetratricopeptide (TPR) repeat protein
MVLGPSNGGGGGYQPYQPPQLSPEQIAAQQAAAAAYSENIQGNTAYDQKDWATAAADYRQALQNSPNDPVIRTNLAHALLHVQNDRGIDAFNNGDYTTALADFQQTLANAEASGGVSEKAKETIRGSIKAAQEKIVEQQEMQQQQQQQEEERQQDKVAANNMQQSIHSLVQTLNPAPPSSGLDFSNGSSGTPATAGNSGNGGGLDFMDSSASLNGGATDNQPEQQQQQQPSGASSQQKGVDISGVAIANDGLKADRKTNGSGNNTTAQALDALSKMQLSSGGTQPIYDTNGPQGKNLTTEGIAAPPGSPQIPIIPKDVPQNDLVLQDGLTRMNTYLPKLEQAKADVQKAQAAVDQAQGAPAKQAAQQALTVAQGNSQGMQAMVDSATTQITDRVIYLQKFKVSGPVATVPSQAAAPVPDPQAAAQKSVTSNQSSH